MKILIIEDDSEFLTALVEIVTDKNKHIKIKVAQSRDAGQPLKPSATPSPVRCRHAKNLLSLNNPRACRHDDDARRQLQHARHC